MDNLQWRNVTAWLGGREAVSGRGQVARFGLAAPSSGARRCAPSREVGSPQSDSLLRGGSPRSSAEFRPTLSGTPRTEQHQLTGSKACFFLYIRRSKISLRDNRTQFWSVDASQFYRKAINRTILCQVAVRPVLHRICISISFIPSFSASVLD